MSDETVFTTPQCRARYLQSEDGPIVQALPERCADYFEIVTGLLPGPAEAQSLFTDLPPDKTYADKILSVYSISQPPSAGCSMPSAITPSRESGISAYS